MGFHFPQRFRGGHRCRFVFGSCTWSALENDQLCTHHSAASRRPQAKRVQPSKNVRRSSWLSDQLNHLGPRAFPRR
jgi:hypothetical protein